MFCYKYNYLKYYTDMVYIFNANLLLENIILILSDNLFFVCVVTCKS